MTLFAAPFGGALLMSLIACAFNWNRAPLPFGVDLIAGDMEIAAGVRMPLVLNGISKNHSAWLAAGGRGIDTAFLYGDAQQSAVGAAIAASGVPREQIFLSTKSVCCPTLRCGSFCTSPPNPVGLPMNASVTAQFEHSLKLLGVDYVDMLLLHFPCTTLDATAAAYAELEAIHASGKARAIGVSNLNASALAALLERGVKVTPAVNQNALSIAGHPAAHDGKTTFCEEGSRLYGADMETVEACKEHGVAFAAYSPLGHISQVDVLGQPKVQAVAARLGRSPAQVAMRWLVQQGIPVVTGTANPAHAKEALDLFGWRLSDRDMRELAAIV